MRKLSYFTEKEYSRKMRKMLEAGRFVAFNNIANEYNRLLQLKDEIKFSDLEIEPNDKERANFLLRIICILSDIVEGAGIDLLSIAQKYDKYVELPMILLLKNLQGTASQIRKIVDSVGDDKYSQSFGDVVDGVKPLIYDVIEEVFNERRV